ncbi:hypothetical protein C8R43DRAFT_1141411 [Mycena crocata]|nr:hypothetical protein C8R43DRAFT_1142794 [Mycena crocata]KAJ7099886.1 hypothetical protein C8R43DRAFT_1141411 [Mycena crocata]
MPRRRRRYCVLQAQAIPDLQKPSFNRNFAKDRQASIPMSPQTPSPLWAAGANTSNRSGETTESLQALQAPIGSQGPLLHNRDNAWCSGCEEGGDLIQCSLCPRFFCSICLIFPRPVGNLKWYCPRCWIDEGKSALIPNFMGVDGKKTRAGPAIPYQGPFLNGRATGLIKYGGDQQQRGMWAIIDCPPLVVISIRLVGMTLDADPASAVLTRLRPFYMQHPLLFIDLSYNLEEYLDEYDEEVAAAIERINSYGPVKVIVMITGHTVPDTGLMHTAPGGAAATDASEVLPCLIPEALQAIVNHVLNSGFQNAIGFSVAKFLPGTGATFLQEVVMSLFVNPGAQKFPHLLAKHTGLGQHTDIILYQKASVYEFSWTHPIRKPFGYSPAPQCPNCHCVKQWMLSQNCEQLIVLKCKSCEHMVEFTRGHLQLLIGKWSKESRVDGLWMGRWLQGPTATSPPPIL